MRLDPGTQIGHYRVEALLGQGGMAAVYKVWHNELHRYEAMKIPLSASSDGEFASRFLQEARHAALQHPHIVAIHNVSTPNESQRYFTMELIEGGDLADLIFQRKRLSLEETGAILQQVADALDFAHSRGVIHRDIKPSNILLQSTRNGLFAKVMDFGISRAIDTDATTRLTKTGTFIGTPEYMSPEQAGSGALVDHHTDQYSLAIIAYEMLCGQPPFKAESSTSMLSVIIKHVRDLPLAPNVLLPSLPSSANDAILKALAKNPKQRFDTCASFVTTLMDSTEAQPYPTLAPIPLTHNATEIATISGESPASIPLFDNTEIQNLDSTHIGETSHQQGTDVANVTDATLAGTLPPEIQLRSSSQNIGKMDSPKVRATQDAPRDSAPPSSTSEPDNINKTAADIAPSAPNSPLSPQVAPKKSGVSHSKSSPALRKPLLAISGIVVVVFLMAIILRKPSPPSPTSPAETPTQPPNQPPPPIETLDLSDGSHYEGPVVDGKMEGTGNQSWPDGSHYGGTYKNGMKNGHGTMTWPDGKSVEAIWANDKEEKVLSSTPSTPKRIKGEKSFPDKSHYSGDLLEGKMHGEGMRTWPDKSTFQGHFANNLIMGAGTLTWQKYKVSDNSWTDGKVQSILAGWKSQEAKKTVKRTKKYRAKSSKGSNSSSTSRPIAPPPM